METKGIKTVFKADKGKALQNGNEVPVRNIETHIDENGGIILSFEQTGLKDREYFNIGFKDKDEWSVWIKKCLLTSGSSAVAININAKRGIISEDEEVELNALVEKLPIVNGKLDLTLGNFNLELRKFNTDMDMFEEATGFFRIKTTSCHVDTLIDELFHNLYNLLSFYSSCFVPFPLYQVLADDYEEIRLESQDRTHSYSRKVFYHGCVAISGS